MRRQRLVWEVAGALSPAGRYEVTAGLGQQHWEGQTRGGGGVGGFWRQRTGAPEDISMESLLSAIWSELRREAGNGQQIERMETATGVWAGTSGSPRTQDTSGDKKRGGIQEGA